MGVHAQWEARALARDLVLHTYRFPKLGLDNKCALFESASSAPLNVKRNRVGAHLLHIGLGKGTRAIVEHCLFDIVLKLLRKEC